MKVKRAELSEKLKYIRDKHCEWGENSVIDEAIHIVSLDNKEPMKLSNLIELLQKLQAESNNDTVVYVTDDDSDDGDLELFPFGVNEGFKSKFGNYIVLR